MSAAVYRFWSFLTRPFANFVMMMWSPRVAASVLWLSHLLLLLIKADVQYCTVSEVAFSMD